MLKLFSFPYLIFSLFTTEIIFSRKALLCWINKYFMSSVYFSLQSFNLFARRKCKKRIRNWSAKLYVNKIQYFYYKLFFVLKCPKTFCNWYVKFKTKSTIIIIKKKHKDNGKYKLKIQNYNFFPVSNHIICTPTWINIILCIFFFSWNFMKINSRKSLFSLY